MIAFPSHLLRPEQSALCLFAAAFGGANDVAFLQAAGLRNVALVDIDKINLLKQTYPDYRCIEGDAFTSINFFHRNDITYDVVVCDQWTGGEQEKKIHEEYFDKLLDITNEYLILCTSELYLQTLERKPKGEYLQRSDRNAGVYWRIINKNEW